jgi:sugar phosphate isomerase/epimerase
MNPLGIEFLSVFGLPPLQFVNLAADLGCAHISTGLYSYGTSPHNYPPWSLQDDPALRRAMIAAMRDRGVSISLGEGLTIKPGLDVASRAAELELLRELGVTRINTVSMDPDLPRTLDQCARLAEMARALGIETTTECGPDLALKNLAAAVDAVRHVGQPDFKLLIDTMHLVRTGGTAVELAALDPALIGYVQLSDAPLVGRFATYFEEAMYERMVPGTGELPLVEILAALPRDVIIGLEVPQRSLALAGEGPEQRLGRCVSATRQLLAAARQR